MGRKVQASDAYTIKLMKDNIIDLHDRLTMPTVKLRREDVRILSLLHTTKLMLVINLTETLVLRREKNKINN